MTPTGCQCVVASFEPKPSRLSKQDPTAPSQESYRTTYQVKEKCHVILPRIIPGMIVQARLNDYDIIVREARLPQPRHSSVLTFHSRGGKLHARRAGLERLPCGSASTQSCEHCPWMVLDPARSAELKAELLREALHFVGEAASSHLHQAALTVDFLEPLSVPIKPHYLQELELVCWSEEAVPGKAPFGKRAKPTFSFTTTPAGSCNAQDCFLLTLEQKRLMGLLNRWADQLPIAVRASLRMAWVAQLSPQLNAASDASKTATRSNSMSSESRWQSSLSLVVRLKQDVDNSGVQSSLCGPNHPPELLSHEEQGLVDAVLSAAPLLKEVHVLVCLDSNELDVLYPVLKRGVQWGDIVTGTGKGSISAIPARPALTCICDSVEASTPVPLPGLHSHLCYTLHTSYSHHAASKQAYVESNIGVARRAFWRHRRALSTTCSVAMTLLLAPAALPTDSFLLGIFTKDLHDTTAITAFSFAAKRIQSRPHVQSQAAATMLLSAALGAAIDVFAAKFEKKKCAGVLKLGENSEKNQNEVKKFLPSVSFLMVTTVTDATLDSSELCKVISAWRDRSLEENTHPAPIFRLLLLQCSTDMMLDGLKNAVKEVLKYVDRSESKKTPLPVQHRKLQAGIIDTDSLCASFVGYALLELSWSEPANVSKG